ncbi:hypothetical protein ASA1KI_05990 [Opitutales bacterium ASA1]|nr:hypothetical protein ASA1KI_05990 [Opitutales bacterium ASA1]
MRDMITTLTERGQISLPASLRKAMQLRPGQKVRWKYLSKSEVRLVVEDAAKSVPGPLAVLGYAKRSRATRRTAEWMKDLRAGEGR